LHARGQHDRPDAVPGAHQAVCVQLGVGGPNGVDVHAELPGELADRRKSIPGGELAVGDQKGDPCADLSRDSDVRTRIQPER
jgi:hypothetical protein